MGRHEPDLPTVRRRIKSLQDARRFGTLTVRQTAEYEELLAIEARLLGLTALRLVGA